MDSLVTLTTPDFAVREDGKEALLWEGNVRLDASGHSYLKTRKRSPTLSE
jgi:hypothetical protein